MDEDLKFKSIDVENQQYGQPQTTINMPPNENSISPPNIGCRPNMPPLGINKPIGWMDGLLGCFPKTVVSLLVKSNNNDLKQKTEEWEIPFESITNLEWLGSGAQGTVFSGYLRNEIVAVKKVRDYKETDIKHLRRLDHENIIKFKGVCTKSPVFCIIMEFCPYGPLQNILKDEKVVQPVRIVSWAKQIAHGMQYLHSHKIIHRDLKSPNILVGANEVIKISDFGTSREFEKSTKMSFAGTVSWMAPEVIRNEPCSEKVDIWSYGVVIWEMLTCEIPYKDVDSSAIIWGVGNNSLHLPIPSTCPEGFKLIVKLCWSVKPRNRPSFKILLNHLEIAGPELLKQSEQEYFETQKSWREEVRSHVLRITQNGTNIHKFEQDLIRKRTAEWKHAQDIRLIYQEKLEKTNKLFAELTDLMLYLQEREREIVKRERKHFPGNKMSKRMSNTLRRIYKQNCEQGYPSAPENQSSLSENTPNSPVKSNLYAELNYSQEAHSVVVAPATGNVLVSQKKIRHRRLGSADSNYSFTFTPKQIDRRNVKMVHMETQTDTIDNDNVTEYSPNFELPIMSVKSSFTSTEFKFKDDSSHEGGKEEEAQRASVLSEEIYLNNGNIISTSNTHYETDRIYDYMNSNEQLDIVDIRESSDEDNLEKLNRRVSNFFNQNGLIQSADNGNGSMIENRLLFNIMAARRSCISITDKEVTVLSRSNNAHTNSDRSRDPSNVCYKISDYNCNNDDGDDSWTDEEGEEETDRNFSLRRKSFARTPIGRARKNKLQMINLSSTLSSSPNATSISDEEGNTSECSQRQTSSSVHSTVDSLYVISNQPKSTPDKFHPQNSKIDLTQIEQ
ncbi:mitogen-activated protein kinase kinase kinase 13-A-like isoform X2 [Sitodiplosis mosellana]|nr:mitogen-activated protein kinase kinase kinase 13-A-like isoform X2 [Sitodiplosis mosellana]